MTFKAEDFKDDEAFQNYVKEQIEPLNKTKDGLLVDIAKLKGQIKEFEGVDIEALKASQEKLTELEQKGKDKETDAQKALRLSKEQHDTEMKGLKESVDALLATNKALIVDDALRAQLVASNVKAELIPSVMKMIKPDVSVLNEDGRQVARVGDKDLGSYVSEWAGGDVGKHFVVVPSNSGGGGGGGGDAPSQSSHAKFFDKNNPEYNVTEQIKLKKNNPVLHKLLISLNK